MTLLVARQCRLLGAAGSLRRLPAAITTRAYAVDASPQLPFRIRKIADNGSGGPPTTKTSLSRAQEDGSRSTITPGSARVEARVNSVRQPPNQRRSKDYNLRATPRLQDCEIGSVDSAILVPASVTATTPEHFVERIESLHADTVNGTDLVVFLATPSFASWLLDESVFLEKALAKLYKNIAWSASLQAVCAVVDRLPQATPARLGDDENPIKAAMVERAIHPPVNETGVEGIAYVILPQKAALSAQPPVSGEQGCIDFLAHKKTTELGRDHDRVRVPLANTVFQTGVPSTLISSTWSLSTGGKPELQSREQRKTMSIDLSAQRLDPSSQTRSHHDVPTLSIPLVPLTFPREVNGHMGNIIRGLKDANGNAMTASTELEQVVPRYFKARGETPQATSAWAVVSDEKTSRNLVNEETELLETGDTNTDRQLGPEHLWTADPPHWDQRVQRSFTRKGRLHKVLSGGGGWGKKAGLLSLDPMPIGAPQPERAAEMDGDYETVDEFSTALRPVVNDGDYIQFYISPAVAQDQDHEADVHGFLDQRTSSDTSVKQPWSWEFGVIPSTIDSFPSDSAQRSAQVPGEITVHKGAFGALTEGGLTLMRGCDMDKKSGIARREFNATTIDVPFARWSAMRLVPKEGVKLQTIGELGALKTKPVKKLQIGKSRTNVSVRDFLTSTFATPERPTAPLAGTIQTTQWQRTFSSTCTSGARRAWLPYKQHKQRKLDSGTPSTEQGGPAQNDPTTEADPQSPPEAVKAILGNLKIPVWKRVTITKVSHHFDDVQWAGQKDRDLLIRRTKTKTPAPATGPPEPELKRGLAKKMVMYRPGGIEPKSETDTLDEPKLSPSQEPLPFHASHGSPKPYLNHHLTRSGGNERSRDDRRTISMTPKRPDTVLNEWDLDASTSGQSQRSFSTAHALAAHQDWPNHERRKKKRRLKRAEQGLPPSLRPIAAPPRPLIRRVGFSKNEPEPASERVEHVIVHEERSIRVRKLFEAQAPITSLKRHAPRTRKSLDANTPKTALRKTTKAETTNAGKLGLPRLLRQLRGEVLPRRSDERANGEAGQDLAKLERFLWREYYRIVSSVRKISRDVPKRKSNAKSARRKENARPDGAFISGGVRKIPVASELPDKLVQQYFASMQTTGRHLAMLTKQLQDITSLNGSQLQAWRASKYGKGTGSRAGGRKRRLIRTVKLTSPRLSKPKSNRPRIIIPRRTKLPHRNPTGLEFVMRPFPLDLPTPTESISATPPGNPPAPSSPTPSSPPSSRTPDPATPGIVPFRSLFTRSLLANLVRHRPALLRKHIIPSLHHQASRMIKRAQILSAQTRTLLPSAPVMLARHATRPRASRRPTLAPGSQKSEAERKTTAQKSVPHRVRRSPRTSPSKPLVLQELPARRVPLGGWKHMYKYFSGRRRARIVKYAEGELAITKVAKKSRRQELADDVEGWLTGDRAL